MFLKFERSKISYYETFANLIRYIQDCMETSRVICNERRDLIPDYLIEPFTSSDNLQRWIIHKNRSHAGGRNCYRIIMLQSVWRASNYSNLCTFELKRIINSAIHNAMMSGKALGHKTHKREFFQIYIHFTCIRVLKQKNTQRNRIGIQTTYEILT